MKPTEFQVRIALSILSGRRNPDDLGESEGDHLACEGFNTDPDGLRRQCEEIVLDAILHGVDDED